MTEIDPKFVEWLKTDQSEYAQQIRSVLRETFAELFEKVKRFNIAMERYNHRTMMRRKLRKCYRLNTGK